MSWTITPQQRFTPAALLDRFPSAAAAYSLRNLVGTSNPSVVRVRRSSDNTEQDFTAAQVTDGTLTTFCGAGDGFVRTWYDQSGNGLHLAQTTTGNQPQIVTSGALETEGSKPCITHSAVTQQLRVATSYSSSFHSVFKVCRITSAGFNRRCLTITPEAAVLRKSSSNAYQMYGTGMVITSAGSFPTTRVLLSGIWLHAEGYIFGYSNGTSVITNTSGAGATASPAHYEIGGTGSPAPAEGFSGNVQEVIVYRSNQT
jgi:hypothetical protein